MALKIPNCGPHELPGWAKESLKGNDSREAGVDSISQLGSPSGHLGHLISF